MISIVNYQAGNIKSLLNSLTECGYQCCVTEDENTILESDLAILPGVGAFPDAVVELKERGLWEVLKLRHNSGKPMMGICLGMQLFYESSEEQGKTEGLGFLKGKVTLLSPKDEKLKIPHMGWNTLYSKENSGYLEGFSGEWAYFVHSYGVTGGEEKHQIFLTDYAQEVPAFILKKKQRAYLTNEAGVAEFSDITRGTIIGFQFHPEKSGTAGKELLKRVIDREVYSI